MKRVAVLLVVGVLAMGCRVTKQERQIGVYTPAGIGVVMVGLAMHQMLIAECDAQPGLGSRDCEDARLERRNVFGLIGIGALVAAIVMQASLEVEEPELKTVRIVEAPPPPPDRAKALHGEAAMKLARAAQVFAAEGKCVEAIGSLAALRRIDRPLADQLAAWDPTVTRCRKNASETSIEATVETGGAPGTSTAP